MPRKALTKAAVERVKPPAKGQVDIFDKGYPGLALRVSYGGGKSFGMFYRIDGKLRRLTLGTFPAISLAEAREAWRLARKDVDEGRDPAGLRKHEKQATHFAGVADEWLRRDQAGNKSIGEAARVVSRELKPAWGGRQISDITRRDVLDLIDSIVDRGSPVMARRVLAYVHRLFKWAMGRGIVAGNPAAEMPKPGSETRRDRVLSDSELRTLWHAAVSFGWPFGDAPRLLILTGARREEINGLRWSELEGNTIRLCGDRTKSGEPHTIPLSKAALGVIASMPRIEAGDEDYAFSITGATPVSGWSRIKADLDDETGLALWRIHDLRRTVATGLQRLGVGLQVIEAVLGHVSGSRSGVVGTYQRHAFEGEKVAALSAWGAHIMAVVDGRKSSTVVAMRRKR